MPRSILGWEDFVGEKDKQENQPITFYDVQLVKNCAEDISHYGLLANNGVIGYLIDVNTTFDSSYLGMIVNANDEYFNTIVEISTPHQVRLDHASIKVSSWTTYTLGYWLYLVEDTKLNDLTMLDGSVRTYTPFPITHGEISTNTAGEIDSITIAISNISSQVAEWMDTYDGLRSCEVIIRKSFRDILATQGGYMEDTFYIDSAQMNDMTTSFNLTSKFDINQVKLPKRTYQRHQCQWRYKGDGCWLSQPDDWVFGDPLTDPSVVDPTVLIENIYKHKRCPPKLKAFLTEYYVEYNALVSKLEVIIADPSLSKKEKSVRISAQVLTTSGVLEDYPNLQQFVFNSILFWILLQEFRIDRFLVFYANNSFITFLHSTLNWLDSYRNYDGEPNELYRVKKYYYAPPLFRNKDDACDQSFDGPLGCKHHRNLLRFGGFPTIPYGGKLWFIA